MKRSIRIGLYALLPLGLLVGTGLAFAHGMHQRSPERMKKFVDFKVSSTLDDLDATADQRAQITSIVDAFMDKMSAEHQQGESREMVAAIAAAIESNSGETAAIDQMIDERAARRTALAHEAVAAGKSINALLTPEQRAELADKIRSHHRHRGDHDGGRGPF
jgi:Spy/CpxP family protein refolding chaperone